LLGINAEELTIPNTTARVFYDTMFQLQGSGSPEVRAQLPKLLADTRALFELYNPDLIKNRAYSGEDGVEQGEWDSAQDRYGKFLRDYLKDPSQYRGKGFHDKIVYLNKWLQAGQSGSIYRVDSDIPEGDRDLYGWALDIVGKQHDGTANSLRNLAKMYRTGGKNDYYSQQIHNFVDRMAKYWSMQGMSEADIFQRLTSSAGQQTREPDEIDEILDQAPHPRSTQNLPINIERQNVVGTQPNIALNTTTPSTGISSSQFASMPASFNAEEEVKKNQGLPYAIANIVNGKLRKGTMFAPTASWEADQGALMRNKRIAELMSKI
jgi:hypothetical protein